jgi:hypothetical protein
VQLDPVTVGETDCHLAGPGCVEWLNSRCRHGAVAHDCDTKRGSTGFAEDAGWVLILEAGDVFAVSSPQNLGSQQCDTA